jgi:hypothetical protein
MHKILAAEIRFRVESRVNYPVNSGNLEAAMVPLNIVIPEHHAGQWHNGNPVDVIANITIHTTDGDTTIEGRLNLRAIHPDHYDKTKAHDMSDVKGAEKFVSAFRRNVVGE